MGIHNSITNFVHVCLPAGNYIGYKTLLEIAECLRTIQVLREQWTDGLASLFRSLRSYLYSPALLCYSSLLCASALLTYLYIFYLRIVFAGNMWADVLLSSAECGPPALVLGADLNSEEDSSVYELLVTGAVKEDNQDIKNAAETGPSHNADDLRMLEHQTHV
jgi:hypothetical protein